MKILLEKVNIQSSTKLSDILFKINMKRYYSSSRLFLKLILLWSPVAVVTSYNPLQSHDCRGLPIMSKIITLLYFEVKLQVFYFKNVKIFYFN